MKIMDIFSRKNLTSVVLQNVTDIVENMDLSLRAGYDPPLDSRASPSGLNGFQYNAYGSYYPAYSYKPEYMGNFYNYQ